MEGLTVKNQHLVIGAPLIAQYFGESNYVFVKWMGQAKKLLLAPASAEVFYQVHKDAQQGLLKVRNLEGDKAVALYDVFREVPEPALGTSLSFEFLEKIKALKIDMEGS